MLVECTVHIGGAGLIMICLPASPVQSFLWEAVDSSLEFLSSSILTYWISRPQSLISGLSDMVAEEVERGVGWEESNLFSDRCQVYFTFFKRFHLFTFKERGREEERERNIDVQEVVSPTPPIGDLAHNPDMCPDWESNQPPFSLQVSTQSPEPQQPGLIFIFQSQFTFNTILYPPTWQAARVLVKNADSQTLPQTESDSLGAALEPATSSPGDLCAHWGFRAAALSTAIWEVMPRSSPGTFRHSPYSSSKRSKSNPTFSWPFLYFHCSPGQRG